MRHKRWWKQFFLCLRKISLFFFFTFLFFYGLFFLDNFFKVKVIKIEADSSLNNLLGVESLKEKNIFFILEDKEEKRLKEINPKIKEIKILKKYPQTLNIYVKTYSLAALIRGSQGFLGLSEDGRILFTLKNQGKYSSLPLINYYQLINQTIYKVGDWIDFKDIKITLILLDQLKSFNLIINGIDIVNEDMIVFKLKDDKRILFTSKKDWQAQIFPVFLILRHLKIEGKQFRQIDVRFDKPIIKF